MDVAVVALAPILPPHDLVYFIAHLANVESVAVGEAQLLVEVRRKTILLIYKLLEALLVELAHMWLFNGLLRELRVFEVDGAPTNLNWMHEPLLGTYVGRAVIFINAYQLGFDRSAFGAVNRR